MLKSAGFIGSVWEPEYAVPYRSWLGPYVVAIPALIGCALFE